MKRDLDLLRQLLIDIENQGAECAPSVLRTPLNEQTDDRIRYHVRQLIDAGLVKEVERTMNGAPCVRITHAGHELIELSQSEAQWQEAKWVVRDQTGGESLTVLKAVLTKWAAEEATQGELRRPLSYRTLPYQTLPAARTTYNRFVGEHRVEPRYHGRVAESRYDDSRFVNRYIDPRYYENRPASVERTTTSEEELRLVQTRPDYLERFDWRNRADRDRLGRGWYAYDSAVASPYAESPYYSRAAYGTRPYAQTEYVREQATKGEIGISLPIHVV